MSPGKKILGPPKGAASTLDTAGELLGSRFGDRAALTPEPDPAPAAEPEQSATEAPAKKATKSRPDPAGMTRRTYYLTTTDADALEAAVERVQTSTNNLVPKHKVYAAVFRHGTDHLDEAVTELTTELLKGLTPPA